MARKQAGSKNNGNMGGITRLSVAGYKSLSQEQGIEIRPLTILAGANSSGKSSLMQPSLLMKQTLEASYDPGPLLLNGPNVKFTSVDQLLSRNTKGEKANVFSVGIETAEGTKCLIEFRRHRERGLDIVRQVSIDPEGKQTEMRPNMSDQEIVRQIPEPMRNLVKDFPRFGNRPTKDAAWRVGRNKCFLEFQLSTPDRELILRMGGGGVVETIVFV